MGAAGSLIQSELYNLKDYYLRVALRVSSSPNEIQKLKDIYYKLFSDTITPTLNLLNLNLNIPVFYNDQKELIPELFQFLDQYLKLMNLDSLQQNTLINFINNFYEFTSDIRDQYAHKFTDEFPGPRLGVIQSLGRYGYHFDFKMFSKNIKEIENSKNVLSFINKRSSLHHELLYMAKNAIATKDYPEAYRIMKQANEIKQSAESMTLLGWTHSFLGQNEEAKNCCLKAISIDPSYGNPYNDLGSYYLQENKIELAKEWFIKAKQALNYSNREYPYINLGKIYVMEREFDLALREFKAGLAIAPESKEIKSTIEKLQNFLTSGINKIQNIDQENPNVQN